MKIRGCRIELGEVEAVLQQHPAIQQAIAIVTDLPEQPRLVAYLVADHTQTRPAIAQIQQFLKAKLPAPMIPSAFVWLAALPLTPNGKVDRRALPAPDPTAIAPPTEFLAPQHPGEALLAQIWAEVLRVERVGLQDDFFTVGGHSLLATQVVSRVRQVFEVELPLRSLFEAPTVAELWPRIAALSQQGQVTVSPPLQAGPRDQPLPLSFAQERLWFLNQLHPGNPAYNLVLAARLQGSLDVAALEQSVNTVIQRHESLRTCFPVLGDQPVQAIAPSLTLVLNLVDLESYPADQRQEIASQQAIALARQPFDLEQGPLLRLTLLRLSSTEYVLVLVLHHIIADGWSMGVFLQEFAQIYRGLIQGQPASLPDLTLQYADFALWQRQWLSGTVLENQLHYWQQQLRGPLPVLQLPTDYPRPTPEICRGGCERYPLDSGLSQALQTLSRQEGVTLFMTLLAAFKVLLYRTTQQTDLILGTDVANRNRAETETMIGFLVNLLVLRTDLSGNPRFQELLRRVRQITLDAYSHQDLPFGQLVAALQPERQQQSTPLFQVLFVLQNQPTPDLNLPGLTLEPLEQINNGIAKFDLALFIEETPQGLQAIWRYNADLFAAPTITRLATQFVTLLECIVAQPSTRIDRIDLLTASDKAQQAAAASQLEARKLARFRRSPQP